MSEFLKEFDARLQDQPRLPRIEEQVATAPEEPKMRYTDLREEHHDQIRADAINAVLRAKGIENLMTAYEAAKVFTILSHLEELAGYSG